MKPQFSVIFLTTLIGAGQGLFVALFTAELTRCSICCRSPRRPWFYFYGSLVAFALTGAGLVSSFFHLGRPERAWRSAARWRTSWLSREVIVLPAFIGAVLLYAIAHFFHVAEDLATLPSGAAVGATIVIGLAGTLLAFALFLCTAMIYACVQFLREWATPLTVVNYTLLGCASGFALAAAYSTSAAPPLVGFYTACALALTLLGFVGRTASLVRNARLRPKSTLQTAIGIKHPRIVQRSGYHRRLVQHPRVLSRPVGGRSCARSDGCSSSARSPCPCCCSRRDWPAPRPPPSSPPSRFSMPGSSPNAGSSSRRRTTRRTCITRPSASLAVNQGPFGTFEVM